MLLLLVVQPMAAADLKYHWASSALLVAAGSWWALSLPRQWIPVGLTIWLAALATLTLILQWQAGLSDGSIIAGLLPYSDAAGYFFDAQNILGGEPISAFSSRRPLFTAWLAGLLWLCSNDLRIALIVIGVIAAACIAFAVTTLRHHGASVAMSVAFAVVLGLYYRRFVGTTLTEQLGFPLGLLGFALLWSAGCRRSLAAATSGIFLLALALNARAGAFFVLPFLVLWIAIVCVKPGIRFSWRAAAAASGAVLTAFAVNRLTLAIVGGESGAAFSNFSYVLYGLVAGGDWTTVLQHYPELDKLTPTAQAQEVYRLAFERIHADPAALVTGALRAWLVFIVTAYSFAGAGHGYAPFYVGTYALSVLALFGLLRLWRECRAPWAGLLGASLIGTFISVPFVPPWDADAMRVYAATLPFLAVLPALALSTAGSVTLGASEAHQTRSGAASSGVLMVAIALLFSLFVPLLVRSSVQPAAVHLAASCSSGTPAARVQVLPGSHRTLGQASDFRGDLKKIKNLLFSRPTTAAVELISRIQAAQLPLDRLQRNAETGHAPPEIRQLASVAQPGETLGIAWVNEGTKRQLTHVLLRPDLSFDRSRAFAACRMAFALPAGFVKLSTGHTP